MDHTLTTNFLRLSQLLSGLKCPKCYLSAAAATLSHYLDKSRTKVLCSQALRLELLSF